MTKISSAQNEAKSAPAVVVPRRDGSKLTREEKAKMHVAEMNTPAKLAYEKVVMAEKKRERKRGIIVIISILVLLISILGYFIYYKLAVENKYIAMEVAGSCMDGYLEEED